MRPQPGVSSAFLLLWADSAKEEILSRANGFTFLEISKASFRPIPVVRPADTVMRAFARSTDPLYRRIVTYERQSRTLTALREALLPKLISGEIRVGQAEKAVEAVP